MRTCFPFLWLTVETGFSCIPQTICKFVFARGNPCMESVSCNRNGRGIGHVFLRLSIDMLMLGDPTFLGK